MKNHSYTIQIPEPCHEDWNKMQPNTHGRFCGSCNKTVIDFSSMPDSEIKAMLLEKQGERVCGHFRKSQINRPLQIHLDLNTLPKNMSTIKRFSIALLIVFGSLLFSCKDLQGQTLGKMKITINISENRTRGEVKISDTIARKDTIPETCSTNTVQPEIEPIINGGIKIIETPVNKDTLTIPELLPIIEEPGSGEHFTKGEMIEVPYNPNINEEEFIEREPGPIDIDIDIPIPEKADLEFSVYPNPSAGESIIKYTLAKKADVLLEISDSNGKKIETLVDMPSQHTGNYIIPVNLHYPANGTYLITLKINEVSYVKKLILEK